MARRTLGLLFLTLGIYFTRAARMSQTEAAHLGQPSDHNDGGEGYGKRHIQYRTVPGFFQQDDPDTNATEFDYTKQNLGLIDRKYPTDDECEKETQWQRFACYVRHLNRKASDNVQYKVLIMGRHGEGWHNVAEAEYSTPAWDCYWSKLDGNGDITWADAHLTDVGKQQALVANKFWADSLATKGIPAPESYYTSPLTRCLQTARLSFSGLDLPDDRPFKPLVKELLREAIGIHTCDRRSTRTHIHSHFPRFPIEPGFAEHDPLWTPDLRETTSAQVLRLTRLLDDVFAHDESVFISFTSHSGSIGAILKAVGHREFSLNTGAVIPVLVRAEWTTEKRPYTSIASSTTAPTCTVNPTASASATGG